MDTRPKINSQSDTKQMQSFSSNYKWQKLRSYDIDKTLQASRDRFPLYKKRSPPSPKTDSLIVTIRASSHQFLFLNVACMLVNSIFLWANFMLPWNLEAVKFDGENIEVLENWIDELDENLPALKNFLLPVQSTFYLEYRLQQKIFAQYVNAHNPIFSPPATWTHKINKVYASYLQSLLFKLHKSFFPSIYNISLVLAA